MKLFASDYDGTFYKHNRQKGEIGANIEEVGRWQKAGNLFIFATGRSISMMQLEKRRRRIRYDYIVGLNGAIIVDEKDTVLLQKAIDSGVAREIVALIEESGIESYSITDGFKGYVRAPFKKGYRSGLLLKLLGLMTRTYHLSKSQALQLPVVQIAVTMSNQEQALAFARTVNAKFEGKASAFANLVHVDIQAPGLSKATGTQFVAKKHQIADDRIIGMGDSFNDLPMFESFFGVTLPEATEAVKQEAAGIYETVGHALKDLR